jgi:Sec-independent protein translocase protein TatA
MLSLSPAKLLVILVVALIVLGPEKLPQMARQLGALWHDLRKWRSRLESEVRGTFPNLPPPEEVARAVRSPLAFLDRLADEHERLLANPEADSDAGADSGESLPGHADGGRAPLPNVGPDEGSVHPLGAGTNGAASNGVTNGAPTKGAASSRDGVVHGAESFLGQRPPGPVPIAPDDPSMN